MKKSNSFFALAAIALLLVMGCKVEPDTIEVESIVLSETSLTLTQGTMKELVATVMPANADDKTVKWSSKDRTVAMVDNGTVVAIKKGSTAIIAEAGGKMEMCLVTVQSAVDNITLDRETLTLAPGETGTLKATVTPYNADNTTITWSSSDTKVAMVDNNGTVTAHAEGTATIIAKVTDDIFAKCTVYVTSQPSKPINITIENGVLTRYYGNEATVVIPDSVTSIGENAFCNCSSLTSVTIPNSVKYISCNAFVNCDNLNEITFEGTKEQWKAITGSGYIGRRILCSDGNIGNVVVSGYLVVRDDVEVVNCIIGTVPANVVIPDGITSIGENAFRYCTSLESVTIPNSVTSIGDSAFYGHTSLTDVTIGNGVTSIGDDAFYGCENLTEITFEGTKEQWKAITGSERIGQRILCSDGNIGNVVVSGYLVVRDDVEVVYCIGTVPANVVIPDGITSIGNGAFNGCTGLTSVTIGDSVTSIGDYAFSNCDNLKEITFKGTKEQWNAIEGSGNLNINCILCSDGNIGVLGVPPYLTVSGTEVTGYKGEVPANVVIPDGITGIGNYAFNECTKLTSMTIPGSVTSIGEHAFSNCNNLTSVTIGDSVTSIGDYAFSNCDNLKEITFKGTKEQWKKIEGSGNLNINCILCSDGNIGVLGVPPYLTVSGTEVTGYKGEVPATVVIPDGITGIGDYAFYNCTSLTSVTIGNGVTGIGDYAFSDCTSLMSVTIGNGVTSIGDDAFRDCTSLMSVTIGNGVTGIGDCAFLGCDNLEEITFNGTKEQWKLIEIGDYNYISLIKCSNGNIGNVVVDYLWVRDDVEVAGYTEDVPANVVIPNGITSIRQYAFNGCTSLTSVEIPDSVTSIGEYAFSDCTSLTSVTIGNGVTSIGKNAFYGCTSRTSVIFAGTEEKWKEIVTASGWLMTGCEIVQCADGNYWFNPNYWNIENNIVTKYKGQARSVTIPDVITSIGSSAFYGCTSLTSVSIGNGVTSIGECAFSGCTSLMSVSIGDKVTSIGSSAFRGCTSLMSVSIPNSVTSIGGNAFDGCTSLMSVTIPNSVTSIGFGAFNGCTNLTSVEIPNSVTSIGDWTFKNCTSLKDVTIPNSVTSIGFGAFNGCTNLTSVEIPNNVTSIGWDAFYSCTSLTSVTIPDKVTSIGSGAFGGCTNLTSVTIGNSVTSIENATFSGCTSLTSVSIPDSVTSIGDDYSNGSRGAFEGCTNLTKVTLSNRVTSIGSKAFKDCTSLTSVTIPNSVKYIGWEAFYGCTSLTSVTIPNSVTEIRNGAFDGCSNLNDVKYDGTQNQWASIDRYKNSFGKYCDGLSGKSITGKESNGTKTTWTAE